MAMPALVFDNKNHFVDITSEDVRIKFADTEIIEGHTFRHVENGIFAAEPAFEISNFDMFDMVVKYRDVVYMVEELNKADDVDKCMYRVIFAYSSEISNDFNKLVYTNFAGGETKKIYDKEKQLHPVEFDFYRSKRLDTNNLPENKSALMPLYKNIILPNGRQPWMQLANHIGIEVEEGIYYFAESGDSTGERLNNLPVIGLNDKFEGRYVAAICHSIDFHFSFDSAVEYLAIGKEHFPRLKEIQRLLSSTNHGFYHEYEVHDGNADTRVDSSDAPVAFNIDDLQAILEDAKEEQTEDIVELPNGVEELVEGLGFYNLCVRYERPFFEPVGFKDYDIAYKLEEKLVLGIKEDDAMKYEHHDLRFMSALYVKKDTRLTCGIDYPVIHTVFDLREERLRQVLTPEAYGLYVNERNALKNEE